MLIAWSSLDSFSVPESSVYTMLEAGESQASPTAAALTEAEVFEVPAVVGRC